MENRYGKKVSNYNLKKTNFRMIEKFNSYDEKIGKHTLVRVATALDPNVRLLPFNSIDRISIKSKIEKIMIDFDKTEIIITDDGDADDMVCEHLKMLQNSAMLDSGDRNMIREELERYLNFEYLSKKIDPLKWWQTNGPQFPRLKNLVPLVLCMMATSVPSEEAFSVASELITKRRNRMGDSTIQAAMCLSSYLNISKVSIKD